MKTIFATVSCVALIACGSRGGSDRSSSSTKSEVPENHRASGAPCTDPAPPGNITCGADCPDTPFFQCGSDSDCTAGRNGRCIGPGGPARSYCAYDACASDAECTNSQPCACHGSTYANPWNNVCAPGNCRVDADCGAHGYCSPAPSLGECSGRLAGYYCHTPDDTCINDSDCETGKISTYSTASKRWACDGPIAVCT
jgi:hypothetical protein